MTAQLPSINEKIYRLANHIAGAKGGLPTEWQDWAEEIETDLRALLAAHEQEPVAVDGIFKPGDAVGVFNIGNEFCEDHLVAWTVKGQNLPAGNYWLYITPAPVPAVPDGYVLMPMKLTAENGAKYALSGEFHVLHRVTCHECGGEGCSDCDDDGWLEEKIMIGWDDIKDIYRAAVEACSIKSTGEGV